jgi:hypothetical protein
MSSQSAEFNNQAICSVSDVDTFRVMSSMPNQKLTATLTFNMSVGQLNLSAADGNGVKIDVDPTPMGNTLVLKVPLPTQGVYFVRVGSSAGTNTYGLSLLLQ